MTEAWVCKRCDSIFPDSALVNRGTVLPLFRCPQCGDAVIPRSVHDHQQMEQKVARLEGAICERDQQLTEARAREQAAIGQVETLIARNAELREAYVKLAASVPAVPA